MSSLVKSPDLTPAKIAANQANARQSHGPATPEGVKRMRAANTRHGYYSQAPGAEMRVLGEDPEEFERLFESLVASWEPQDDYQTSLVRRMARLTWRLERSDRIQEAIMVHQMEALEENLARETREAVATHERVARRLKALVQAIDGNKFCSTEHDLDGLEEVYGKEPKGVGLEILTRVYRLLSPKSVKPNDPNKPAENADPAKVDAENELTIATGAERDVLRAELRILLRDEIKRSDEAYERRRAELEISSAFRDSMLVPRHPQASLLVRLGDSDLRQLRFVSEMLMKLKARGRKPAPEQSEAAKTSGHPTI